MESLCVFYTSENHLGVILLEYLKKKCTNKYIIKTNLKDKKQINILKEKYFNEINNFIFKKTEENEIESNTIYIIEGNKDELETKCKRIEEKVEKNNIKNVKIIKCFDFYKNTENIKSILEKNNKILNTFGKKTID